MLGTWATEIEIIATACLLQTSIYVYGQCGKGNKWQKHSPDQVRDDPHQDECIYITNLNNHFETVKKLLHACINATIYRILNYSLSYVNVHIQSRALAKAGS